MPDTVVDLVICLLWPPSSIRRWIYRLISGFRNDRGSGLGNRTELLLGPVVGSFVTDDGTSIESKVFSVEQ